MQPTASVHVQIYATEAARPLANFHPSPWGDRFVDYTPPHEVSQSQKEQEVKELQEMVRKKLVAVANDPKETISLVDAIERLGLAYHFENEIEAILQNFHNNIHNDDSYKDDLNYVSVRFRLLREHGFYVSCDVFDKFKHENGSFKESLLSDVHGMLNLYQASHLRLHGEKTLDEALQFTTTHLTSLATQLSHPMDEQIIHALKRPLYKRTTRLESKCQILMYESQPSHDKTLLRFAKLDFDLLQSLHKKELRELMRWWRSLDFTTKLPFVRDRVVEVYFWILGVYYEPKYSYARIMLNKWFKIASVIDDTYDAYGIIQELELFTEAIQRLDKSGINRLPDYMKLIYQTVIDTFQELEQDLAREGRSYVVHHLKEEMKNLCRAYLQEAKWLHEKHIPSYDEYMRNGISSSGMTFVTMASYQGMGEVVTKDAIEWIHFNSKSLKALCQHTRIVNDLAGHKFERERDHVVSSVECYMEQFGVSQEEAYEALQLKAEKAWKDIKEEMVGPSSVPMSILSRILNFGRTLSDIYDNNEDGYTNGDMQAKIEAILINPA